MVLPDEDIAQLFSGLFANFDLSVAHLDLIFLITIILAVVPFQPLIALSTIMSSKSPRRAHRRPLFDTKSHGKSKFSTFLLL